MHRHNENSVHHFSLRQCSQLEAEVEDTGGASGTRPEKQDLTTRRISLHHGQT